MDLEKISDENPIKLVFKMAKKLIEINPTDENIYNAKVKLLKEIAKNDKVKTYDHQKALLDFLEYLFIIQDEEICDKYDEVKKSVKGVEKMSIDEIRKIHYMEEGRLNGMEVGLTQGKLEVAKNLIQNGVDENIISISTDLTIEEVRELKKKYMN
jgi:predicted transposase/invertase (TIGR01784 family)